MRRIVRQLREIGLKWQQNVSIYTYTHMYIGVYTILSHKPWSLINRITSLFKYYIVFLSFLYTFKLSFVSVSAKL